MVKNWLCRHKRHDKHEEPKISRIQSHISINQLLYQHSVYPNMTKSYNVQEGDAILMVICESLNSCELNMSQGFLVKKKWYNDIRSLSFWLVSFRIELG